MEDSMDTDDESANDIDPSSRYQVLWTNVMAKGRYANPSVYQKAEVLILCWEQASSDMDTKNEVERLKSVFRKSFGYGVTIEKLNANLEKKLQVQVNGRVARFVEDHDGPNTLLIVYYAGHGKPGDNFGDMELYGKIPPKNSRDTNKQADVLEIFDCCYAGQLALTRGQDRLFEYLAATKPMDPTALPGDDSFTSALIWALEQLVEEKPQGRFTTKELLDKIKNDAPHFPKHQFPQLSDRDDINCPSGRIMLHPLQADRTVMEKSGQENATEPADGHVVTLDFEFGKKPSDDRLWSLGERFNELFERNTFAVNRVRWRGMKRTMFGLATRRFQASIRKRRASRQSWPSHQAKQVTIRTSPVPKLDTKFLSPQNPGSETQDSMDVESPGSPMGSTPPSSDMEKDPESFNKSPPGKGDLRRTEH
ncbi:MAG: hypothetical protein LQ338_007264 [Usnochroma carphineum]|nr:MAG: hypothetical protein LQ338_007264 [Usnochroma carphineum]